MNRNHREGSMIIVVCSVLAVLTFMASSIVTFGYSELAATRIRNDLLVSAYYVAISGAELMYAHLKTLTVPPNSSNTPTVTGSVIVGSTGIGTYSATVYPGATPDELCVESSGTVNRHTAKASVMLGCLTDYLGLINVGAYGQITINGASNQAKVKMEGPAASSTLPVIETGRVDSANDPLPPTGLPKVDFWLDNKFDTNSNSSYITGADPDSVTRAEAIAQEVITPGVLAEFDADDVNADSVVDDKDSFIYYYTIWLNDPVNSGSVNKLGQILDIGEGQARYYPGGQIFTGASIPDTVPIIYVNGNATVTGNVGSADDCTVVVLGDLTLNQPGNSPGDRTTYVVFGNVVSTGEMGHAGGTKGDLVIFANGNISVYGGGKMNASMYSNGSLIIDTLGTHGYEHLMLSSITEPWDCSDPNSGPLGIPPDYPTDPSTFSIKNQTNYPPVWQRE